MELILNVTNGEQKERLVVDIFNNVLENGFSDSCDFTMWGCSNVEELELVKDKFTDEIYDKYGNTDFMLIKEGGRLDIFKATPKRVINVLKQLGLDEKIFNMLKEANSDDFMEYDRFETIDAALRFISIQEDNSFDDFIIG